MLTVSKRNISVTIVGIGIFEKTKPISLLHFKMCVPFFTCRSQRTPYGN